MDRDLLGTEYGETRVALELLHELLTFVMMLIFACLSPLLSTLYDMFLSGPHDDFGGLSGLTHTRLAASAFGIACLIGMCVLAATGEYVLVGWLGALYAVCCAITTYAIWRSVSDSWEN